MKISSVFSHTGNPCSDMESHMNQSAQRDRITKSRLVSRLFKISKKKICCLMLLSAQTTTLPLVSASLRGTPATRFQRILSSPALIMRIKPLTLIHALQLLDFTKHRSCTTPWNCFATYGITQLHLHILTRQSFTYSRKAAAVSLPILQNAASMLLTASCLKSTRVICRTG